MKSDWEEISEKIEQKEQAKLAKANNSKKLDNKVKNLAENVLERTNPDRISINDVTDLKSITDILNKIDEKHNNKSGNGVLPPLSTGKENIIENAVHVTYNAIKQDDGTVKHEKSISVEDIAKMTPEQVATLITDKEKMQNDENVDEII